MKLEYILTINDEEAVEDYKDVHPELVLEDIIHGGLGQHCSMRKKCSHSLTTTKEQSNEV